MASYELSPAAERDIHAIVEYTLRQWGARQVRDYMDHLSTCLEQLAISEGHYRILDDLLQGMRGKPCGHHYIFGLIRNGRPMLIVGIFHERMDLLQRLKERLQ